MGGSGAKNRRKLQREADAAAAAAKKEEKPLAPVKKSQTTKFTARPKNGERPKRPTDGRRTPDRSFQKKREFNGRAHDKGLHERKDFKSKTGAASSKPDKKPKFKKPKHLKRKIESAEDETAKEKLLQEIKSFEAKKSLLTSKRTPKKQKRQEGTNYGQDENIEPAPGHTEDFPRSTRPDAPVKQPKVDMALKVETNATKKPKGGPKEEPKQKTSTKKLKDLRKEEETKEDAKVSRDSDDDEGNSSSSSSSDSDSDSDSESSNSGKIAAKKPDDIPKEEVKEKKEMKADNNDDEADESSSSSSSDSSSDSNSDSDEEKEEDEPQQRSRGRRRRGRKNTSQQVEETKKVEQEKAPLESKPDPKDKGRYCKGRKPVTDFVVGQSYPGKVVYMKPFGVFLDIGCHSDAFCHISRLSDDYVSAPEDFFKQGDEVPNVRIVEIDRKSKRLTVSLQSEARKADEDASSRARQERKGNLKDKRRKKTAGSHSNQDNGSSNSSHSVQSHKHMKFDEGGVHHEKLAAKSSTTQKETPAASQTPATPKPESEMTPAELKRARKIARRAARRAEKEAAE